MVTLEATQTFLGHARPQVGLLGRAAALLGLPLPERTVTYSSLSGASTGSLGAVIGLGLGAALGAHLLRRHRPHRRRRRR